MDARVDPAPAGVAARPPRRRARDAHGSLADAKGPRSPRPANWPRAVDGRRPATSVPPANWRGTSPSLPLPPPARGRAPPPPGGGRAAGRAGTRRVGARRGRAASRPPDAAAGRIPRRQPGGCGPWPCRRWIPPAPAPAPHASAARRPSPPACPAHPLPAARSPSRKAGDHPLPYRLTDHRRARILHTADRLSESRFVGGGICMGWSVPGSPIPQWVGRVR